MIYAGALYYISVFLIVNAIIYSLRKYNPKKVVISWTLFVVGLKSLYFGLLVSDHVARAPYLIKSFIIIKTALYICYIFLEIVMLNEIFKWKKIYWLLVFGPIVQLGIYLHYVFFTYDGGPIPVFDEQGVFNFHINALSQIVFISYYLFIHLFTIWYIYIKFKPVFQSKNLKRNHRVMPIAVQIFNIYAFFMSLSMFYFPQFNTENLPAVLVIRMTVELLFLLFLQIWPYYYKYGIVYMDSITFYPPSANLQPEILLTLGQKLPQLMDQQKIYLEEDITLSSMAEALEVNTHQLSSYLNRHLNQNFSEYINSYRIKEAKSILKNNHQKNITELCYELGYNSPAVFYKAFKNSTGNSPKEWLKLKSRGA